MKVWKCLNHFSKWDFTQESHINLQETNKQTNPTYYWFKFDWLTLNESYRCFLSNEARRNELLSIHCATHKVEKYNVTEQLETVRITSRCRNNLKLECSTLETSFSFNVAFWLQLMSEISRSWADYCEDFKRSLIGLLLFCISSCRGSWQPCLPDKNVTDDSNELLMTTTLPKSSNMSHFRMIHLLFHNFKTNFPVWKFNDLVEETICNCKALFFIRDRTAALPKQSSSEQFSCFFWSYKPSLIWVWCWKQWHQIFCSMRGLLGDTAKFCNVIQNPKLPQNHNHYIVFIHQRSAWCNERKHLRKMSYLPQ